MEISRTIVEALEEKKGEDIILMDIRGLASFADYFVICSGSSKRMLQSLADAAVDSVRSQHHYRGRIEGEPQDGWMLIDFGEVITHLFSPDRRDYYHLEELWSEGKIMLHLQ